MTPVSSQQQVHFIDLDHDQMLVLSDRRGACIEVISGAIWLTEENRQRDQFIEAGQGLRLEKRGRAVAEAIGNTRLRMVAPVRGVAASWCRLANTIKANGAVFAKRGVAGALALVLSIGLVDLMTRSFHGPAQPMHAVIASSVAI